MNRNEKIIELLEENGFKLRGKDTYTKNIKVEKQYYYTSILIGEMSVEANCDFDEEDMSNSSVDFNISCQIEGDIDDTKEMANGVISCNDELRALAGEIEDCEGDN